MVIEMTDAERYFLIVAEELNISKAARKLFVSHQNVSQHIQKLEEKYGTELIIRRPKLSLTPAGQNLMETLENIQVLENQLLLRINEDSESFVGELSLGMPHPRAEILAPAIMKKFRKHYPNVKVSFVEANSGELSQRVLRGTLDMFVGVQYKYFSKLSYDFLKNENIYLVVSHGLLSTRVEGDYWEIEERYISGIDISTLGDIPFIMNPEGSFLRTQLDYFLMKEQVVLNVVLESGSHEVQVRMCEQGIAASFCTQMHLFSVKKMNERLSEDEKLHVLPVNHLDLTNRLYIVSNKDSYFPCYKQHMKAITQEVVEQFEMLDVGDFVKLDKK